IARYADSDSTAIVSLTGAGGQIGYHPALWNTLLGLRMLQADMLLIDPVKLRSFPTRGGVTVLGYGELPPNDAESRSAAAQMSSLTERIRATLSGSFSSWLITDDGVDIRFNTEGSNFLITGEFYHYFWDIDQGEEYRNYAEQIDDLKKRAAVLKSQG